MKTKIAIIFVLFMLIVLALTYYNFSYNDNENQLIEQISNSEIKPIENDLFKKQELEVQDWPKLNQDNTFKEWDFE